MEKELKDFKTAIQETLSISTQNLILKLEEFNSMNFHPEIKRIDCEIFQGDTTITIIAFLMDDDKNEVFNSNNENFVDSSLDLLEDIKYYPSEDKLELMYQIAEENDEFDREMDRCYIDTVVDWFSDGFDNSSLSIKLPLYIQRHGAGWTFDLQSKEWIEY